jgi:hypothetical protein
MDGGGLPSGAGPGPDYNLDGATWGDASSRILSGEGGPFTLKLYIWEGHPLSSTLPSGEISCFDVRGEIRRCDWLQKPHNLEA